MADAELEEVDLEAAEAAWEEAERLTLAAAEAAAEAEARGRKHGRARGEGPRFVGGGGAVAPAG